MNMVQSTPLALYPKLRPGPHGSARDSVASNQRARLYGAMIELVASRGYEAGTVAELCALAGVSKRTLYERFPCGKQECFLATYDILVRRAEMRIVAAGRRAREAPAGCDRPERLRAVIETFACEVATSPNAARLVLVESSHAGPATLAHIEHTKRDAASVICWSLREDPHAPTPSQPTVKAIVVHGARVVRARLLEGRAAQRVQLTDDLWDLCCAALTSPSAATVGGVLNQSTAHHRGVPGNRNRSLHSNGRRG